MDSAENLVAELERLGIAVWAQADRLRYKAPQGSLTPDLRQRLTDNKERLLALLSRSDGARGEAQLPPIEARAGNQPRQLSYSQQRLWFLAQMLPDSPAYNMSFAYHLRGTLNVEALGQALCEIVRRHSSLRTVFVNAEGQPLQVVSEPGSWTLPVVNLRGEADADQRLEQLLQEAASRGFDLARGPLFRAQLYRLDADTHMLQLTLHHIISDGWSTQLLLRELGSLYDAFSAGRPSPLAELSIQYADFAAWQREWLQGEVLETQLGYCKEQLKGAPVLLELPTDRPRPALQSHRGATETAVFPQSLLTGLKALSREEGASLFMTLLAAFQTLLGRYSGQEDILVGSPIASRNRPEVEGLIGFFVNMLVLRGDLSGTPTFRDLLGRVREVALATYAHQDVPFERLVEELQPERNLSYNPLFQISLALENTPEPARLGALRTSWEAVSSGTSKFDLSVEMTEGPDGLAAAVEYCTDLFSREMILRLLNHFRVLLEGIVADPDQRIMALPLLTEAERRQLLVEWNDTATDYPADALLHELFEAQVARTPDAVAVEYEGRQLTYGDLNARANQLAHYLVRHGVGPDVMVGICVERSLDMVVGILGILKAGGAYVPLDPDYPAARLAFMLDDTAAPVLLTQVRLRDRLMEYRGRTVSLDADWPEIARESQDASNVRVSARNLAYVIYTSGSTGRPKGTCIEHRSVVRLVKATNYAEFGPQEVFLQYAPISFDASTLELWGSLLNGAKLVVCPAGLLSLQELGRLIRERGVTTLWLTAALFHQMVDEQIGSLQGVRQLLAGGETLSVSHVRRMLEVIGRGRLINGYGPTENTTFTCCHVMTADSRIEQTVPIGRPISNTRVYVLDGHMRPVPVGVYGELYIGGDGLAREYLHQPQLTAEKFVPDPFTDEPGERLYRSGDLVRFRTDGCIEFLGRIDNQVKIRGFRIELGEIEAVLAEHPDVRQAAVHLWTVKADDARIVACCVPAKAGVLAPISLRKHLRARLPEYMVPQYFLPVDEIPLTPNGKVDRRRLPTPVVAESGIGPHEAPADPVEATIAEIWTQLIHPARPIGRIDKFFEMGGHSLLGLKALQEIEDKLGVRLDFRVLFQENLADIATQCRSERIAGEGGHGGGKTSGTAGKC